MMGVVKINKKFVALKGLQTYYSKNGHNIFDLEGINLTDTGYARLFAMVIVGEAMYCQQMRKWLLWDGTRWRIDETKEILMKAKAANYQLMIHANRSEDETIRRKRMHFLLKSESQHKIKAMLDLAGAELPVTPSQLDTDPWLLNLQNGTLDLRTMELLKHDPSNLITKLVPVDYDQDAECPLWDSFLNRIIDGNDDLILFLQKAVGMSLIGEQREHVLFILYGTGANGKSTFLNTIRSLLGDYSMETPTETLMAKRQDTIPCDVARLRGSRFVSAVEAGEGRRLNEVLIKQLTGNDTVAARYLYGEYFEFAPQFTLFMATNHKPIIKGTDHAMWRRIRLIPFQVSIPEDEQDKELPAKLLKEGSGILLWALSGLMTWEREGLGNPEKVKVATSQYRADMDTLGAFLQECCTIKEGACVRNKQLYEVYESWCEENKEKPLSMKALSMSLKERGFDNVKKREGRQWDGIELKSVTGDGS